MTSGTQLTNTIDPYVIEYGGVWYCLYKNDSTKYIGLASGPSNIGPWTTLASGDWAGWGIGREGPQILWLGDRWRLYCDNYGGAGVSYSDCTDVNFWAAPTSSTWTPSPRCRCRPPRRAGPVSGMPVSS